MEKSQFLIDSFCRCVIDWASCGEERERSGKKSGKGSTADRRPEMWLWLGSFPLKHVPPPSWVCCSVHCGLQCKPCYLVVVWSSFIGMVGIFISTSPDVTYFPTRPPALPLSFPAGDPRLAAATAAAALERKKWSKKQEPQKEGRPSAFGHSLHDWSGKLPLNECDQQKGQRCEIGA